VTEFCIVGFEFSKIECCKPKDCVHESCIAHGNIYDPSCAIFLDLDGGDATGAYEPEETLRAEFGEV
jgi:hypothetical protein